MKIKKYYSAVTNEQEIPKVGDIGYYDIEIFLNNNKNAFKEFPLDVDITSEASIYDSFKDTLSYLGVGSLKPFLKTHLALILPGIYFSYCVDPKTKDVKNIKVELFSTLKDVPEFIKFKKENNYPESSLALNASHRPLTHKDMNFLFFLLSKTIYCNTEIKDIMQEVFYLMPGKLFIRTNHLDKNVHDRRPWLSIT